jgi:hypothetical protein
LSSTSIKRVENRGNEEAEERRPLLRKKIEGAGSEGEAEGVQK